MLTKRQFAARQARRLLQELRAQIVHAAATADETAIHRTRVATRRWLAAVTAFDGSVDKDGESDLRHTLKAIMKASSSVRDCDVAEKLLQRLEAESELFSGLAKRRAKRCRRLAEVLKEAAVAARNGNWRDVSRIRIDDEKEPLPHAARRVLSSAFKDFLKRGERAVRSREDSKLHKFRIHAKEFRYMLELFAGLDTGFDDWIEPVRRVQSLLGDAHDCEMARLIVVKWPKQKALIARLERRKDSKQRQFRELWRERFDRATIPHAREIERRGPGQARPQSWKRRQTA